MIRLSLALQGGGAHGAFTWGALDRLLDEEDIEIAAISGTSAGAMNAVAFKAGWAQDGRRGARASLAWFWARVGAITDARWSDWIAALAPTAPALARAIEMSPSFKIFDMTTRAFSPYAYSSLLRNPLERILNEISFDAVRGPGGPALFVGATNVRSGKIRVFSGEALGPKAILASACLPTLFRAVEIDDPATGRREAYWDGGYTGNPALFPLYNKDLPADVLIVNINPLYREDVPGDSPSIQNRINEISFNSSLLRELRAVDFVRRLLDGHTLPEGAMKRVLIHMVGDDALMNDLNIATKAIPAPVILARLRAAGEAAMDRFLIDHKQDLGQRDTVDLRAMFS
ncbi:patatin-like phospholipase family protein [Limimaricola cinnabarinus]|uniref:patatin-like phospholipase family protein n=1 Tax=Limimaricola cinnabarinus TaxID=1125964 RepID=UPI000429D6E5|nr:patatin-like phospholipase family protein [Limimaricola cinnabarinus]